MEQIDLAFPATLSDALAMMANEKTRGVPLCGGSDLMVQWESGVIPVPGRAIDIKNLTELKEISVHGDDIVLGAAVSHIQLRNSDIVKNAVPALAEAAATVGGGQIQSMGTIGGSIANGSPAGDIAPTLLASGTQVVVASTRGERVIPLDRFLVDYRKIDLKPDELIVRFRVRAKKENEKESFRKLGPRAAQAISKVMASYRGELRDSKIVRFSLALGSVAPTAILLPDLETSLLGRAVDEQTLDDAERITASLVNPIDDIRSTAEYRKWVSGRIVRGFLQHLVG